MNMEILDLIDNPSSIRELAEWHHLEWAHFNPKQSLEDRIQNMQAYLDGGGGWRVPKMFVCKNKAELLGSAAIVKNDMDTRLDLSPWLASVYVAADRRNSGIGSALVRYVVQYATKAGFEYLYLFTPSKEKFYKALGWSTIDNELFHGQPVTVMQIKLRG